MRPRYSFPAAGILLLALALPAGSATTSTCTFGETGSFGLSTFFVSQFPVLSVYELVDAAQCTACGGGPVVLNAVSWQFTYPGQVLCPITFEVSVVGSDHAACPRPDTTQVLCPPFTYVYAATGGPPHVAVIPLPGGCCVSGQAFVRVTIKDTDGCGPGMLAFVAHIPCTGPCLAYASFTGGPLDDVCNYWDGSPQIAVAADCCTGTPTHRPSWGGLRLHYR